MRKIDRLKREVRDSCEFRRHKMSRFITMNPGFTAMARCEICGKYVYIDVEPLSNGRDRCGEAVTKDCWD